MVCDYLAYYHIMFTLLIFMPQHGIIMTIYYQIYYTVIVYESFQDIVKC
jgi:hypothetical protein